MRRMVRQLSYTDRSSYKWYDQLRSDSGSQYSGDVLYGLNKKFNGSRRRADRMGLGFSITLNYLLQLWIEQRGRCVVTGRMMNFKEGSQRQKNAFGCSIDRINNNQGYVRGNVRLLTHWANNAKSTWPDSVFEDMITEIVNNRKHHHHETTA